MPYSGFWFKLIWPTADTEKSDQGFAWSTWFVSQTDSALAAKISRKIGWGVHGITKT